MAGSGEFAVQIFVRADHLKVPKSCCFQLLTVNFAHSKPVVEGSCTLYEDLLYSFWFWALSAIENAVGRREPIGSRKETS